MTDTAKILYLHDVWEEHRPEPPRPAEPTLGYLLGKVSDAYAEFTPTVAEEIAELKKLAPFAAAAYEAGATSNDLAGDDNYPPPAYLVGMCMAHGVRIHPKGACNRYKSPELRDVMSDYQDQHDACVIARMIREEAKSAVFDAMVPAYPAGASLATLRDAAGSDPEFHVAAIRAALADRGVAIRAKGTNRYTI